MARQHDAGGFFELARLMFEVGPGAASGLGGVARQFDAVDGKHLSTYQSLAITDEQYLAEDMRDVVFKRTDEVGDGGEVRLAVAGQCDEGDVFAAGAFDGPAADDALAVGE